MIKEATKETNGPFYKACHILSISKDLKTIAQGSVDLFNTIVGEENSLNINDCIHIFGKQIPPFTMLMITAQDNKVAIIHSIATSLSHQATNTATTMTSLLAFINDAESAYSLLQIVKLEWEDFERGRH